MRPTRSALLATIILAPLTAAVLLAAGDSGRTQAGSPGQAAPSEEPAGSLATAGTAGAPAAPGRPMSGREGPAGDDEEAAARVTALRSHLLEFIAGSGDHRWGVLVVSLDRGDTLFAFQPDAPLTPASNMKLFTTAAALYYLGAGYRYGTYVASAAPLRGGVLEGDLVLYGTGDPSASNELLEDDRDVWRQLAGDLTARGLRVVRGDVVGDATYFESPGVPEGWEESYRSAGYAAPASALSYHGNTVTLRVTPGPQAGWRPDVLHVPGGRGIAVVNLATTTAGGSSRIQVERLAYDGPIVVEGRIARGHAAVWREVPVADPAHYAAALLREALLERGVRVEGRARSVHDPARSTVGIRRVHAPAFQDQPAPRVLAAYASPPLRDILTVINHKSHNMFAEQVLRTIGREVTGEPDAGLGLRAVDAFLEREVGVPADEVRMHDGSGLSILNRVSPRAVIALLAYMAESPRWEEYQSTLPVAGAPGGLRRMYRSAAENNLRAKTGTIRNVSALSGYVTASNGERLGFSIISNDVPSTGRSKDIENRIGAQLAGFTRPPAPDAGPPQPAAPAETADPPRTARADSAATSERRADARARAAEPLDADAEAASAERTHTIRPGDTLDAIAKRYGVSVGALQEANPGLNPRRLIPGREVQVPAAG